VLEVVSDRKLGQLLYSYSAVASGTHVYNAQSNEYIYVGTGGNFNQSGSTTELNYDSYKPEVISYSDYYPFLMKIPGRYDNASGYRYQGQGQEEDNEFTEGMLSFEYRVHDPRIGRFLSVDPLRHSYPHNSNYSFSENRPIDKVEFEGLEASDPPLISYTSKWSYDGTWWIQRPFIWIGNVGVSGVNTVKSIPNGSYWIINEGIKGRSFTELGNEVINDFSGGLEKSTWTELSEDFAFMVLTKSVLKKTQASPSIATKSLTPIEIIVERGKISVFKKIRAGIMMAVKKMKTFMSRKNKPKAYGNKVDLFGGEKSRYDGYLNFDIKAKKGIQGDISEYGNHFREGSVSDMIVDNPQVEFLENVSSSIESGGIITIRGNYSNNFFKEIYEGTASGMGEFNVLERIAEIDKSGMKKTDGSPIGGTVKEITLQKK
jgi:RHS repeat-associated protein